MSIVLKDASFTTLSEDTINQWREIPPAIASDCMDRTGALAGRIKPLSAGTTLVGQARTVTCMVGDNSAAHAAISLLKPGEVLMVDGGGYPDVAIWGGIMTHGVVAKKAGGVVLDAAVRDVSEIREMGFPLYAAAHVPKGPHKGHGGVIDGVISVGGVSVAPGDLVLGDDDGVTVVPLAAVPDLLQVCHDKLATEANTIERIKTGTDTIEILGIPRPTVG